ncbi:hypothetical protein BASA81_000680 [Batrachochytrium salamandrivorans]|nr:hypothetical protein BASA81_000680 [Batrachochytrium salamandrivorans]
MRSFLVQNIPYDCGQDRLFAIFSQFGSLYPSSVYFINHFWKESLVLEHGTEITCEGRVLIWEELVVNLNLASRPSSLSSSCGARLAIDETKLPAIHVMERSSPSSSMLSSSSATNGSLHSSEEDAATTVLKPTKVRVANLPLDATEEQVRRALLVWGKLRSFRWEPDHPPLILATFEFSENPPNRLFLEELLSGFGVARGEGDRELVVGPMLKRTALVSITKLLGERFGAAVRMSKTSPVPAPTLHKSCLAVFADDKAAHSACHSGVTVSGALFSCTKV